MLLSLPDELIIHILALADPPAIIRCQRVSRRLLKLGRDDGLWKLLCYLYSQSAAESRLRQALENQETHLVALRRAIDENSAALSSTSANIQPTVAINQSQRQNRRRKGLANWDPGYPSENVNYFEEYVHRHAPTSVQYLQLPVPFNLYEETECLGAGLLRDGAMGAPKMAVAPLDNGSICIWDVSPQSSSRGRLVASSVPALLQGDQKENNQQKIDLCTEIGAVDTVSIDHDRQTAFVANRSELVQVDLNTLKVVRRQPFPFAITALSEARANTPLTVGTNMTLHLYDIRSDRPQLGLDRSARCELIAGNPIVQDHSTLIDVPAAHVTLSQPQPLSILHVPTSSVLSDASHSIWTAGRFTSLLHYDRRFWPRVEETVFSGARISSLCCIPYPFVHPDLKKPDANSADLHAAKSRTDMTLCAAGEYKGKGSLELYSLSSPSTDPSRASASQTSLSSTNTGRQTRSFQDVESYRNRQSAARTGLLAVASHGARICVSDGNGFLKWFERDGRTLVRTYDMNNMWSNDSLSVNPWHWGDRHSRRDVSREDIPDSAIIQKILPLEQPYSPYSSRLDFNTSDLMVWTSNGSVGLLGFGKDHEFQQISQSNSLVSSRASVDGSAEAKDSEKEEERREREREYAERMRQALERQADETRWVRGLGIGP